MTTGEFLEDKAEYHMLVGGIPEGFLEAFLRFLVGGSCHLLKPLSWFGSLGSTFILDFTGILWNSIRYAKE
jgi:hypothetical protein